MKAHWFVMMAAAAVAACSDANTPQIPSLTVMTRNVYPGMAPESIMAAPAESIPFAAATSWGKLQFTNFPARAGRLAAEIIAHDPAVVGLQEIPIYRTQLPGDAAFGGSVAASTVALDFGQILLDSLAAHGATYQLVAVDRTTDVEVPALADVDGHGTLGFMDIRYTDGDGILVRAGVPFTNAQSGTYAAAIPFEVAGQPLTITRGWGSVEATIGATVVRFVNTHLEDMSTEVQTGQVSELLAMLAGETKPLVLLGDFNSDAIHNATPTYATLTSSGFTDLWTHANPGDPGASCCNAELLSNPATTFDQRLDLILVREGSAPAGSIVAGATAELVGNLPADRTAGGLWPSDHAGVVATVKVPA